MLGATLTLPAIVLYFESFLRRNNRQCILSMRKHRVSLLPIFLSANFTSGIGIVQDIGDSAL